MDATTWQGGQSVESAVSISVKPVPRAVTAETLNQWTHGFGCVLALIGTGIMVPAAVQSGSVWRIVGAVIYCLTLVGVYLYSTLSHSFEDPVRRRFYRMMDQVCIFLLSAGSFTPFGLVHMPNGWGSTLLAGMWIVAFAGVYLRVRESGRTMGVTMFVLLGWMPLLALPQLISVAHAGGLALVIAGGLAYTGGLYFLLNDSRKVYFHAIWHISTITGSACHFLFHLWYVVGTGTGA